MPDRQPATETHSPWHALSGGESLQRLAASADGLSSAEAEERRQTHGLNRLRQAANRPAWRRFLAQFNNILMLILVAAGAISLLLDQPIDAAAIFGVVLVIALIGFIQEGKAERALESIKGMLSPQANALRDGRRDQIPAEALVPGDVVLLEAGDRIPADLRLLEAHRFRTQEAALTGESEPVDKQTTPVAAEAELGDRRSMAFAGTLAVQGTARGLVVETGDRTQIGRISELLGTIESLQTPLLRHIERAGRVLAVVILAAAVLTGAVGVLIHGWPWSEMFMASVGLAVASIPEGLPAIVTITLALGVQAMARRNAIIRRMPAVETLGATTLIFSDKTGTLTRNQMTAQVIALADGDVAIEGVGFAPEGAFFRTREGWTGAVPDDAAPIAPESDTLLTRLLIAGALCNDATLELDEGEWRINGDPTEGAFLVAAAKAGYDADALRTERRRLDVIPFEPERKYMATLNAAGDAGAVLYLKGAPDRVIGMCQRVAREDGDAPLDPALWEERIRTLSAGGLRVLAVAEKPLAPPSLSEQDAERDLVLLGLVGLLDPPRAAAVEAVARCVAAGIRPVMVTGDHALTARAIAARLGLRQTERAITGKMIEGLSDAELRQQVQEVDVFARAAPEHKLRLVQAAQANGEICAMTGDGVNDAPALKRADVGVAMGQEGTEAAREAADMVLADDNFASIVNAVEEGRKVYDNIRKTITFLLPTNGAQGLAIMLAVLAGTLLPVTPVQALWVNMVSAGTLGLALAFEPGERGLMQRPPRDPKAPLLDFFLLWRVLFVSVLLLTAVYGLFLWLLLVEQVSEPVARSGAVNMLVMGGAAYLINSRFLTGSALSLQGLFGSRPVLVAIGLVLLFQLVWTYTAPLQRLFGSAPIGWQHWGLILAAAIVIFLLVELEKALWRHRNARRHRQP